MAKTSVTERNKKRENLVAKYRERKDALQALAHAAYVNGEIPWDVYKKMQSLPRNAHSTRIKKRCRLCGRPHGVFRRFGMCRLCLRKYAMLGYVPGVVKSSW